MWNLARIPTRVRWLGWSLGLVALILGLYWPARHYGLIWDDPHYYQLVQTQTSLTEIFLSPQPPTYQFYRPLAVAYAQAVMSPGGVVNAPLAHLLQISAHSLCTLLLMPVLMAFGLGAPQAALAALLFAIFPWSYYGVAWEQNQQPLVLLWLLLALWLADLFGQRRSGWLLGVSLLAYAAALLFQEGATAFVIFFFWLNWLHAAQLERYARWWSLGHLGLLGLYIIIRLSLPLQSSVTGPGLQLSVLAYLTQGLIFPVTSLLATPLASWPILAQLIFFAGIWCGLSVLVMSWVDKTVVGVSWVWSAISLAPLWVGLSWDYAQFGPRLLYLAAVGMAVLWSGYATQIFAPTWPRKIVGWATLLVLSGVALGQWWQFQRLFQVGTQHLNQAVAVISMAPDQRLLFVNFPDRLEFRSPVYPSGFWGLLLAPVVQDLADYARATHGVSAESDSVASFVTGNAERESWPYRVDLRGVDLPPEALWQQARDFNTIYLTEYLSDGTLQLHEVGGVRAVGEATPLARFGEAAVLLDATLTSTSAEAATLRLTWQSVGSLQAGDTIFVHLWQSELFVRGYDGDSVGGLIPPAVWQMDAQVIDVRRLPLIGLTAGDYEVRVGLYNRNDNERYLASPTDPARQREDGVLVATLTVP